MLRYLGIDGYVRLAKEIMGARDRMIAGIEAIDGLYIAGAPDLAVMGYGGRDIDMFAVAEELTRRGWFVSTMSDPPGIHLGMPTMAHVPHVETYLRDLRAAVETVRAGNLSARSREVSYGG